MDAMESKMAEWRRRVPSKRALTSQLGHLVQQKSVAVLYTQSEQERIKNVTELINTATSEFEKGEHWDRIIKVVDVLTNTSNKHVLKEAVRYVRLRLGDPSPRVVLLTLTLTEALMKNCNKYVHKEIGGEAFMAAMEALYKVHSCKRGRDSMEIEGRVLELIQTWGEAFMNQKFEFPYFIYTYEKLRKKGVKFPKYDKTKAPMFSSAVAGPRRSMDSVSSSSSRSSGKSTVSSELAKLSSKEVFHVATNVAEMFEDMLHEAERESDNGADRGVIVELAAQAQDLVMRLQTVIQAAADSDMDDDLSKYLAVNDSLHVAISRYEDLKSGQHKKPSAKVAQTNGNGKKAAPANDDLFGDWGSSDNQANHNDDDDDDGFGDFVRARVGGGDAAKPAAASSSNNQTDEDDPFASFVAQRATKTTTAAAPAKDLIDLWDDAPAQQQTFASAPAAAPASAAVDLWGDDLLLQPAAPAPAPVVAPAPVAKHAASPFDDIWADLVSPAPAAPAPTPFMSVAPVVAPAPAVNNQTANPFDFFDDFSSKATISAPVSNQTQAPAPAKANPFDFGFPLPSSQTQAPVPAAKPVAALNPFDF